MRFVIFGTYHGRTEEIDEFDSQGEADHMLGEYRTAFGAGWALWVAEVAA